MKYVKLFFIFLLSLSLVSYNTEPRFQKARILMQALSQTLQQAHYNPVSINDEFSENVFDDYLSQLDYSKKYFLKEDIERLQTYKHRIDDQVKDRAFNFFNLSIELFNMRLAESKQIYESILAQPFNYEKDEAIDMDPEQWEYVNTHAALKERWRKLLKYQTLVRLADKIKAEKKKAEDDPNYEPQSTKELEKKSRESVLKSQQNLYDRIIELDIEDHRANYLNIIGSEFDPHTAYFPPKDKENFDISMSGSFEGIGATLQKKDGYIKVVRIVVGSACWRQGDLEVGDLIMKVAQADKDPVNVMDMPLDEAVQLIRGPKGSEVRLTVKKRDGSIEIIPIIRDVVELRETFAQSAIIENNGTKAGYIQLPKFYVDLNNGNGRSCYTDVKTQLEALKSRDIEGIIFDLRNNGGGSLGEVINIAGLFIEKGPIVQVRSRYGVPEVLYDKNKEVAYNGPLIVLVNSLSASASEIFAGAMQDYNRGLIVGSQSTFGKGTVQRFVDFDRMLPPELQAFKPLGALKLTIQKFYRINGSATQLRGIQPDIQLPDAYAFMDIGEKERENAMGWDKIDKLSYQLWQPKWDKKQVIGSSKKRIANDSHFQAVLDEAKSLKQKSEDHTYPLQLDDYMAKQDQLKEEAKALEDLKKIETTMQVKLFQDANVSIAQDSTEVERRDRRKKDIAGDLYINESLNILNDML